MEKEDEPLVYRWVWIKFVFMLGTEKNLVVRSNENLTWWNICGCTPKRVRDSTGTIGCISEKLLALVSF